MCGHFRGSGRVLGARVALAHRCGSKLFVAQSRLRGGMVSHGNHQPTGPPAGETKPPVICFSEGRRTKHI
jgi:hypothetical protein